MQLAEWQRLFSAHGHVLLTRNKRRRDAGIAMQKCRHTVEQLHVLSRFLVAVRMNLLSAGQRRISCRFINLVFVFIIALGCLSVCGPSCAAISAVEIVQSIQKAWRRGDYECVTSTCRSALPDLHWLLQCLGILHHHSSTHTHAHILL